MTYLPQRFAASYCGSNA